MSEIVAVYCDGGVVLKNPSVIGGTFAACFVNEAGERIATLGGTITPQELGLPVVTNNATELLAAVHAIQAIPDGWAGVLCSDSGVTLGRLKGDYRWAGIPDWLRVRTQRQLARMGRITYILLGGHPTKKELAAGVRRDGKPVSKHNVWCDEECWRLAFEMVEAAKKEAARKPIDMFSLMDCGEGMCGV